MSVSLFWIFCHGDQKSIKADKRIVTLTDLFVCPSDSLVYSKVSQQILTRAVIKVQEEDQCILGG